MDFFGRIKELKALKNMYLDKGLTAQLFMVEGALENQH